MAGIGFKLRKLTETDTPEAYLKGYGSAAVVCAGPWLLTILALMSADLLQNLKLRGTLSVMASEPFFHSVVTYCFAFSLILTGGLQNLVTRYLADKLYQKTDTHHLPTLIGSLAVLNPIALVVGAMVFGGVPALFSTRMVAIALFVVTCDIWMATIFLGAVRAYWEIVQAYLAGCAVTAVGVVFLGGANESGLLAAFTMGQSCVLFFMLRILCREFNLRERPWDFAFLDYAARYPYLALAGTTFYLGVWCGVFFYWSSPAALTHQGLRSYPLHDISYFWGLLTTVPAMTYFFVRTETHFYDSYRAFYGGITEARARYFDLAQRKAEMRDSIWRGAGDLLKFQGIVTLLILFYVPRIIENLDLSGEWISVLRAAVAGALALCLCQFAIMILYYYELYKEGFRTCLLVLAGNLMTCFATWDLGLEFRGWGLLVGSLLGLLYALRQLNLRLESLEYYTFMFQPMPGTVQSPNAQEAFGKTIRRDGKWLVPVVE